MAAPLVLNVFNVFTKRVHKLKQCTNIGLHDENNSSFALLAHMGEVRGRLFKGALVLNFGRQEGRLFKGVLTGSFTVLAV